MEKETQGESNLYSRYDLLRISWWYRKILNIFIRALGGQFESQLGFNINDKIDNIQRGLTDGSECFVWNYLASTHGKLEEEMFGQEDKDIKGKSKKFHRIIKITFESEKSITFSTDGYEAPGIVSLDRYYNCLDDKSKEAYTSARNHLHDIEFEHFRSPAYANSLKTLKQSSSDKLTLALGLQRYKI